MNLAPGVLGAYTVSRLQLAANEAVIRIGKDTLTRGQLAAVGCYNFVAAKNLSAILKALEVPSLRHVFDRITPSELAIPRMGVISLAVLGAAFEAKGIGGERPLETYVRKHTNDHLITFDTLKHREQAEVARERKERKARKAQRRDKAHRLRSDRFDARTATQIATGVSQ